MRLPRPASESGFSLVELMIATLIISVAVAGMYSMFDSTQTFYENYSDSSDMRQQARVGIDLISTELRSAGFDIGDLDEALTVAGDTSLQFVADLDDGDDGGACDASYEDATDGGAERVTYTLDTNSATILRTIDCYNGSAWTNGVQSSTIAQTLDTAVPVFKFYDADGNQLPGVSGGTLSESNRADVASVEIVFDLVDTSETQLVGEANTSLHLSTRVRLHNVVQ
ncbi:MAG: prepilin-type N-terminal cleavage/methylation domain-containing protein [Acidobacteria bacterium]|nr:prepilin-type N-terminal cleavage/methylation domain-containing protein [Acidobacteriota bacterium]